MTARRSFLNPLIWIPFLLAPLYAGCVTPTSGGGDNRIFLGDSAPVRIHPSQVDQYTCGTRAVLQCDHETTVAALCGCVEMPVF